ncbi:MAG: hypothetical protein QOI54_1605 [Actinomycetota bacterium]|nr:hypothetical protein [Actinomycetota bacterium]
MIAVLVLAVLAVLSAAVPTAGAAQAAAPLATITVDGLEPTIATPGGQLQVTGEVRSGRERLRGVRVALRLSRTPVNSRAELDGVASGLTTGKDGDVVASQQMSDLSSGGSAGFDLTKPLDSLDSLTDFGVYVLSVEVTARHRTGEGRVGIVRTFLPWVPRTRDFRPTPFVWAWPLVSHPARQADGRYADDRLAAEMAEGGRLSRLTAAGSQLSARMPVTWAVDPDLLDSASDMSNGYRISDFGRAVAGTGAAPAAQWLAQVRGATAGQDVLALPYADPDLSALRHVGLSADVSAARTLGAQRAAALLGRPVTSDVAWPADGFADRRTLGLLHQQGDEAVVLDGAAQPTRLELNYTATGRSVVGTTTGSMTGLLADPGLTGLLASRDGAPVLAAQRFLAETAMITAELPSSGAERVILIAPPRRWDPPQAFLDRLVAGAASAPWISGTSLATMRSASPGEVERRGVHYPASRRRAELPRSYLAAVKTQHERIRLFLGVLPPADRAAVQPNLHTSVFRLESSWWRGRETRVNRISNDQSFLADQLTSIRVQPGSYTLGSKSGSLPLTISNGTDHRVIVVLRLDPENRRLRLREPAKPIPVAPRRKVQVDVGATAVAGGTVVVDAALDTVDGMALSTAPVKLTIQITQIGTVALIITLSAAGVLFLAAAVRVGRRLLAARRTPTGPRGAP